MRSLRSLPRRLPQLARAPHRSLSTARLSDLELENARLREEIARLRQPTRPTGEGTLFVGAKSSYTTSMDFWYPHVDNVPAAMPCFRIMDDLGRVVPGAEAHVPALSREHALACMHTMLRVNEFDKIFLDAQRQGRISFYLTGRGEEGATVGSAAALQPDDWVLPQYRELGVFFWRGFTFQEVANQLCATAHDPAHGRQLPLHIGSKERCILYVKSTLATQAPHATGVALHMKRTRQPRISIAYFGEGTASHGDIPSALNIAAVHGSPMIFFCRNNGYAISTNAKDQYRSDGIAPRGPAFGLPTIRIDGNDLLAVVAATKKARDICLNEGRPCLIEAMTYRIGAHSTSDDDTKYRTRDAPIEGWDSERAFWEARSPIIRFGRYLASRGWWNTQMEDYLRTQARRDAIASLNVASQAPRPAAVHMFTDVYDKLDWNGEQQRAALREHFERYPEHYSEWSREGL